MGKAVELREVKIADLKPYERNAKVHSREQVRKIGESIRRLGFISPCLIDHNMNVIAGHGRIMAAKEIGQDSVPCVFVEGLTDEQRRAYILEDNRLAEMSDWDMDMVGEELKELKVSGFDISTLDFDIDIPDIGGMAFDEIPDETETDEEKKGKAWNTRDVRCDMKPNITVREKNGRRYVSLHANSKEGMTLEEIKNSRKCEKQIAEETVEYIRSCLGGNLSETGWGLITTGRRRHRDGYHFATEICKRIAKELRVTFYEDAISCGNADRLKPKLELVKTPEERNLILFDDIITTGTTMDKTTALLQKNGYTVLTIIGIRNQ